MYSKPIFLTIYFFQNSSRNNYLVEQRLIKNQLPLFRLLLFFRKKFLTETAQME